MTALERGQLGVMLTYALMMALAVLGVATVAGLILRDQTGIGPGVVIVAALVLVIIPVLVAPLRRFRAWGYAIDADELQVAHGTLTHIHTVVPLGRVQHIDVSQGPIERAWGVCRLVLHTAGTMHSKVVLPGLGRATAEAMRDEIRARIRQEAA